MSKRLLSGAALILVIQAILSSPSLAVTAVVGISQVAGWNVVSFSAGDVTYPGVVDFVLSFENNGTVGLNVSGNVTITRSGAVVYAGNVFEGNVSSFHNRSFYFNWTASETGDFLANLTLNITSSQTGQSNQTSSLASFTVYSPPSGSPASAHGSYTPPSNATAYAAWDRIPPNTSVAMAIQNATIAFSGIVIFAQKEAEGVKIWVNRLYEKPASVKSEPPGQVYQYVEITHSNLEGSVKSAVISFRVEKKWISDNGVNASRVSLQRYAAAEEKWEGFAVVLAKEDSLYFYYSAEVTGLSVFSVTGMKIAACQPGGRRCSGSYVQECSPEGVWENIIQCDACDAEQAACVQAKTVCSPGEKRCSGAYLQQCAAGGFGWDIIEECRYGCWDNECKGMVVSFVTQVAVSVMFALLAIILSIMAYLVCMNARTFLRKKATSP